MAEPEPRNPKSSEPTIVRGSDQLLSDAHGGTRLNDALHALTQQARIIIGAHQAALSYIPGGNFQVALHAIAFSEKYEEYLAYDVIPTGEGIWAAIAERQAGFCMSHEELLRHPRWRNFSGLKDQRGLEHPPMRGWLAVPVLSAKQEFIGVLQLSDKYEGDFTPQDLELLTHLAKLIAPTFELQFVSKELQQLAVEMQEQHRVALLLAEEAEEARRGVEQSEERLNLALKSAEIGTWNVLENAIVWDDFIHPLFGLAPGTFAGRTAEQREYLGWVKVSAETLSSIINDVLDLSKIEARRIQLEEVDFDPSDVLGDVLKIFALRARQKEIELAGSVSAVVPNVLLGDPGRLRQVLVNLLGNAIKFTERGEVEVMIDMAEQTDSEVCLHFTVRDTGIGIPASRQSRIFDPFTQADRSATRRFGGTGLGLTISSQLVELMGGSIWLESEVDQGSTFYFSASFRRSPRPRAPLVVPQSWRDLAVLVVDDHDSNRRNLRELLTRWGMRPTVVASGQAALAAIEQSRVTLVPFRLLLLDGHMPGMDGFSLADRVQRHPAGIGVPLLLLISAGSSADIARCRELGVGSYLAKPIQRAELFAGLQAALFASGTASSPSRPSPSPIPSPSQLARAHIRFLLAEDSPVNQLLVRRLLQTKGHSVAVVNNGREALRALDQQPFDVILMDIEMPEMDGLEATTHIRRAEQGTGRHVPILAITAHALQGDCERCLNAGMDGYITKPIRPQELFDAIDVLLRLGPRREIP